MYNKEQKKKFIEEYAKSETTERFCKSAFRFSEPMEIALNSDVCQMTVDDFQKVIDYAASKRVPGRLSIVSIYYSYISWCVGCSLASKDALSLLSVRRVEESSGFEFMVGFPRDLANKLNSVFAPISCHSVDNVYRGFFWLAYMGVSQNDIPNVLSKEVDLASNTIRHGEKKYHIYPEAVEVFDDCVNLDQFVVRMSPTVSVRPRVEGEALLRGVNGVANASQTRYAISRRARIGRCDKSTSLTYRRVWVSGLLYRIWLLENRGVELDFEKIAKSEGFCYVFDTEYGKQVSARREDRVAISLQQNYEKWKAMFAE